MNPERHYFLASYFFLLLGFFSFCYSFYDTGGLIPFKRLSADEVSHSLHGGDFRIAWATGVFAARNDVEKIFDDDALRETDVLKNAQAGGQLSLYPPQWIMIVAQLIPMGYDRAWPAFFWFSFFLYITGVLCAYRALGVTAVVLALGFSGLWNNLIFGQNSLLVAGLLLFAQAMIFTRPWLAGAFLSLATIKPQLGFLWPLYLLITKPASKNTYVFISAGIATAFFCGVSYFILGREIWVLFFQHLHAPLERLTENFDTARADVMISTYAALRLTGLNNGWAWFGHGLVGVVTVFLFLKTLRGQSSRELKISAMILATLLLSPHAYSYDLVLLIIPVLSLLQYCRLKGWRQSDLEIFFTLYLFPSFVSVINIDFRIPLIALFLLYALYHLSVMSALNDESLNDDVVGKK